MPRIALLILLLIPGLTAAEEHWSLRPRARPAVPRFPEAGHQQWVRNPIDAFILNQMVQAGLKPAAEADRRTLIRRLSFDLTGLPPTPAEIDAFVNDPRPDAYEKLVERLLASPNHGERWGRHWLDVVRFAETEGFEYDRLIPGAWRYRDYVIRALNDDKPFDRFLTEQLAGDELDPDNQDLQIAAGLHRLGPVRRNAGNPDVAFSRNEVLTEMTDVIGSAFLGLTVGCARCHDHKFDSILQSDYYRLQAFLAATHEHDIVLADARTQADWKTRTEQLQEEMKKLKELLPKLAADARVETEARMDELRQQMPLPLPTISTVRHEPARRSPIHILKRGDEAKPGQQVGPRVLSALLPAEQPELAADVDKPRTKLARWLTDPAHPLTARVLVNRLWQYHFGTGLVATANDFGLNGGVPSHPELLDFLANYLAEEQGGAWSMKKVHRLIVSSSTYRQASAVPDSRLGLRLDPDNRLLWHFPRRRLDAEEIRDAMLAMAGQLNRQAGGPGIVLPVDRDLVHLLYDPTQWAVTPDERQHARRSIYLLAKRNLRHPFHEAFDQPDAQTSCACRQSSTHALQALELLNGRIANQLAAALARRVEREAGGDRTKQVEQAFLLAAGRLPTTRERDLALRFLQSGTLDEFALAVFNLNAFLYVD